MKIATFAALAAVTAAVVGGAFYATQERDAVLADAFEKAPLYPGIADRLNDATFVRVETQSDGPLTMSKQGDKWTLAEKDGYAADIDKIRQTLVELASLEKLEPKTKKPENHADLAVEPVDGGDGGVTNSIHVTVKAGDEVLADLLIGRARPRDVGGGVFVRKNGDDQVWLASGSYQPKRRTLQWLDRSIINIDSRRTALVEIVHSDGDRVAAAKPDISAEDMAWAAEVPEGMEPKPVHEMNNLANITDFLVMEDVRMASELDWTKADLAARFHTYDGLMITMMSTMGERFRWFQLSAATAGIDDRLAAFVEQNKGQDSEQGRIADQMKSEDVVAAEAAALQERLAPWAFRFTDFKSGKAASRTTDMLQPAGTGG